MSQLGRKDARILISKLHQENLTTVYFFFFFGGGGDDGCGHLASDTQASEFGFV